ncbi:nucleoside phosphorylase domain-containing protein [Leucosporidium creatinivorum]|uniref:Nucleoside phosphorylase domain-containing protein n=1 Tax=Leucosporidium creatinivorum TaxID=106004 RepID=A0A1Y2FZG1_9BASI|nr:nucleoside phosphorylase domain-containing protein [Leucosporidium creatinivorum]
MKATMHDANFPKDSSGAVYHIGVKPGEVANRIVTCGDPIRLRRFATFLDPSPKPFELVSSRGYTTITGCYKGVPISLIAIGMGVAMVDFLVREVRAVVSGDLAIVRFGSCGSLSPELPVGSIGVPRNAMTISTNYAHFHGDESLPPYVFSPPISSDPKLHQVLVSTLDSAVASSTCKICPTELHASADCFYSSQGRIDPQFKDDNADFVPQLLDAAPEVKSLEMETAHLFHLASVARHAKISAAACHMIFADRVGQEFIDPLVVAELEPKVGRACLDAIISFPLSDEALHPEEGSVWEI